MKARDRENIIVYDIRGQICPSCLLFTLREVHELREALNEGRIEVLIKTDNRDATSTIPDAVASMGYDHFVEKKEGFYEIRIMRHKQQKLTD